ncbi:MAG: SDR family NAD(P)-dependent oxidoreductase, partial [Vulcanimicrobiaceae bacterium]
MSNRLDHLFALDGRTALVTGGNSGIGLAMAEALGRQGARIVLVARRRALLEEAAADLSASAGITVSTVAADLAAADGPDRVVDAAGGAIDIVVNA